MDVKFPIGELQVPEKVTKNHIDEWLQQIGTYTARLKETIASLTEEDWNKTYREGSWNVLQLVHHIADSQLNMFQRLKMALTDDHPTVPNFDQDAWAVQPDTELPAEVSINLLEAINEKVVALGKSLTEEQLIRTFNHEINGKITVATKLAKLAWHEEHHLAHIKIALEK